MPIYQTNLADCDDTGGSGEPCEVTGAITCTQTSPTMIDVLWTAIAASQVTVKRNGLQVATYASPGNGFETYDATGSNPGDTISFELTVTDTDCTPAQTATDVCQAVIPAPGCTPPTAQIVSCTVAKTSLGDYDFALTTSAVASPGNALTAWQLKVKSVGLPDYDLNGFSPTIPNPTNIIVPGTGQYDGKFVTLCYRVADDCDPNNWSQWADAGKIFCQCPPVTALGILVGATQWTTTVDGTTVTESRIALDAIPGWPAGDNTYTVISFDGNVAGGLTIQGTELVYEFIPPEACLIRNAQLQYVPNPNDCICTPVSINLELHSASQFSGPCLLVDETVGCEDNPPCASRQTHTKLLVYQVLALSSRGSIRRRVVASRCCACHFAV